MDKNNENKPLIEIPVLPKESELSPAKLKDEFNLKFKDINYILLTVVVILLVMVANLVIDSFHINSAIYKEYSEKNESINIIQKTNQELLEENKQNQETIIELQKRLLNKN